MRADTAMYYVLADLDPFSTDPRGVWNETSCEHASSPKDTAVYFQVVLYRHGSKSNDLPTVTIRCTYMRHPKHYQLLVLIDVQFLSEVACMVWDGVQSPCSGPLSSLLVCWSNSTERLTNSHLSYSYSFRCKKIAHRFSSIRGTNLQ